MRNMVIALAFSTSACFSHVHTASVDSDYVWPSDAANLAKADVLAGARNGGISTDCKGANCDTTSINGVYYGYGAYGPGMLPGAGVMQVGSPYLAQTTLNGIYAPPIIVPSQPQVIVAGGGQGTSPETETRLRIVEKRTEGLLQAVSAGEPAPSEKK